MDRSPRKLETSRSTHSTYDTRRSTRGLCDIDHSQLVRLIGSWILIGLSVVIIVTDACLIGLFIYDHCSYQEYPFSGTTLGCVPPSIAGRSLVWCNGTAYGYSDKIQLLFDRGNQVICPDIGSACPVTTIGRLEMMRRWLPAPSSECLGMDLAWVIVALVFSVFLLPVMWFIGIHAIKWIESNSYGSTLSEGNIIYTDGFNDPTREDNA